MVHARSVSLDCIVLLQSSVRWLHQALRIDLTIKVFLSSLQLRSHLVRYDLRLIAAVSALHHLMDADAAVVAEFDGASLVGTMLGEFFQPVDILLSLIRVQHAQIVEEICVGNAILHTQ